MPGDVVDIEVYAKYIDTDEQNWTPLLNNLIAALSIPSGGIFIDGGQPGSLGNETLPFTPLNNDSEAGDAPNGYLNYIIMDRDFNKVIDMGAKPVTTAAREYGQNGQHERLFFDDIVVREAGYMYIYISNESEYLVDVFFDDLKVTHTKSPIVQQDDYYPFGLIFNSYSRENSIPQRFLYQEKEWQQDLSLNLYDFEWRLYDPLIVRTTTMDPHAERYPVLSPYSWVANNPLSITDPDGQDITSTAFATTYTGADAQNMFRQLQTQSSSSSGNGDTEKPTFYSFNKRTQARREQMASEAAQREKDNQPGFLDGFKGFWSDTKDHLVNSITTWDGYLESMADGLTLGTYSGVQRLLGIGNLAANIPNYTSSDYAYGAGYATGIASSVLLTRGTGATARFLNFGANGGYGASMNLGRLGKFEFMYRNPSVRGGTLLSYKSVSGGKFRLDFHTVYTRGRALHFHTNYWGYSISPHRSLNPFRFGQPIK